jgi:hypothetical protein
LLRRGRRGGCRGGGGGGGGGQEEVSNGANGCVGKGRQERILKKARTNRSSWGEGASPEPSGAAPMVAGRGKAGDFDEWGQVPHVHELLSDSSSDDVLAGNDDESDDDEQEEEDTGQRGHWKDADEVARAKPEGYVISAPTSESESRNRSRPQIIHHAQNPEPRTVLLRDVCVIVLIQ